MDVPTSAELVLIACELAKQVECRPQRRDGTDAAVYVSSGATIARRIRAGVKFLASCNEAPMDPNLHPARFCWVVCIEAGTARQTNYRIWLDEAAGQLTGVWQARKEARALRDSLTHDQRKNKPWGLL